MDGNFKIVYSDINRKVTSIRFDPDEGEFRKFSDLKVHINQKQVKYSFFKW